MFRLSQSWYALPNVPGASCPSFSTLILCSVIRGRSLKMARPDGLDRIADWSRRSEEVGDEVSDKTATMSVVVGGMSE